ncbi:UDP-glucose 4-epimerase GalE [Bacteriovoracales bacterium]|nr:UDP-glucose 4-epimerase GalE [Bacteriovoracales bacterium]
MKSRNANTDKKKYIVTGGNGFIGSHMCRELVEQGHQVLVIDNFSTSKEEDWHGFGELVNVDIGDFNKVKKVLKLFRPDGVYHFAGRAIISESENNPLLYYSENVSNGISLIKSCVESGVRKMIFSSTCATFGQQATPVLESNEQNPINTYGRSKLILEKVLYDLSVKGLMDTFVFRYFNAAGCSEDGLLGEYREVETRLIPNIFFSIYGKKNLFIYGDNFETLDGTAVRDYIHVLDLVKAHSLGMQKLHTFKGWQSFNLGTGTGYSILEVISMVEKITGKEVKYSLRDRRVGDPSFLVSSCSASLRAFGFSSKRSLKEIVIDVNNFFIKRLKNERVRYSHSSF